ncbi:MAG: NagC family transcriptional regulator [Thermoprotei archaeon]|mgnify:FL=1|nr:MAG: NagC family transcriptional regulator [Thermoprotei archaeon]
MRRLSPRDLRRLSKRLGLSMEELSGVREVRILLEDGRCIVFDLPKVVKLRAQGVEIYQVMGESRVVEAPAPEAAEELEIPEEDVQLVAEQAGVSLEEARRALIETGGDLAQAIMLLTSRKAG